MRAKLTPLDRAELMYRAKVGFLAGKWFLGNVEIPNVNRYLYKNPDFIITSSKELEEAKSVFMDVYGDPTGWWPENPIIEEARHVEPGPLAFPLNHKQLMIINRLLDGRSEYMYILTGIGGSGKSTFGNIVRQIFGNDCASLTLSDLSDGFMMAMGVGKRLIFSDELNSGDLKNNIVKMLISKQCVSVNPKYGHTFTVRWQGNLMFNCNKTPKLDISDSGLLRRICYYSMNEKVKNPDPLMKDKVYSHADLVNFVAHALRLDTEHWFEINFEEDTHDVLMSRNSVHLCDAEAYPLYRSACLAKGYSPYAEDKWQDIHDLFEEWDKQKKMDRMMDPFSEEALF